MSLYVNSKSKTFLGPILLRGEPVGEIKVRDDDEDEELDVDEDEEESSVSFLWRQPKMQS